MTFQLIFIACLVAGLFLFIANIFGAIIYDFRAAKLSKKFTKHPHARSLRRRPFVSIFVTLNNSEDELKKCLFSIARNSYRKYEIIIVDDGSTNYLQSIKTQFHRRYPSKKIKVSKNNSNDWRSMAKKSSGEYIIVLSAAFELEKHAIAEMAKHFALKPADKALTPNIKHNFNYTLSSLLQQYEYLLKNQWQKTKNIFSVYDSKSSNILALRREYITRSTKVKYLANMRVSTDKSLTQNDNEHPLLISMNRLGAFLAVSYLIYLSVAEHYSALLALVWVGFSLYLVLNIWAEDHIEFTKKIRMCLMTPMVCLLFYLKASITIFRLASSKPIRQQPRMELIS